MEMNKSKIYVMIITDEEDVIRRRGNTVTLFRYLIEVILMIIETVNKIATKNVVKTIRKTIKQFGINAKGKTINNRIKMVEVQYKETLINDHTGMLKRGRRENIAANYEQHMREVAVLNDNTVKASKNRATEIYFGVSEMIITSKGNIYGDVVYMKIVIGNCLYNQYITIVLYELMIGNVSISDEMDNKILVKGEVDYYRAENVVTGVAMLILCEKDIEMPNNISEMIKRNLNKCNNADHEIRNEIEADKELSKGDIEKDLTIIYRKKENNKISAIDIRKAMFINTQNIRENWIEVDEEKFNDEIEKLGIEASTEEMIAIMINNRGIYKKYKTADGRVRLFGVIISNGKN